MVQWLNYVTDFFAMLPTDGREKAIDTLPPRPACRFGRSASLLRCGRKRPQPAWSRRPRGPRKDRFCRSFSTLSVMIRVVWHYSSFSGMYENKTETPRAIDERGSGEGGTPKTRKKKPPGRNGMAAALEAKRPNSHPATPGCRPMRPAVSLAVARVGSKTIEVNRAMDATVRSAPGTAKGSKAAGLIRWIPSRPRP